MVREQNIRKDAGTVVLVMSDNEVIYLDVAHMDNFSVPSDLVIFKVKFPKISQALPSTSIKL